MQTVLESLPRLFLKPSPEAIHSETLFCKFSRDIGDYISFRSMSIESDIDLINRWVNRTYAIRFWQMNGSKERLIKTYSTILASPDAHSFIGLLGTKPICQIDVYRVLTDELSNHVSVSSEDCGIHILMAPNHKRIKGLTLKVVTTFLKFYFSFPIAHSMYGEPDTNNQKAKKMIESLGFEYLHEAKLSYKTASVYKLTRESFTPVLL